MGAQMGKTAMGLTWANPLGARALRKPTRGPKGFALAHTVPQKTHTYPQFICTHYYHYI